MNSQVLRQADRQAPRAATVERCVELLCQQGCARVNEYIAALRSGQPVPGIDALDDAERHALLEELVSIMAVYHCGCDDG
jgi:hypothetical protein